jgi:translation initiation factor IF-3
MQNNFFKNNSNNGFYKKNNFIKTFINKYVRAEEMRVIDSDGKNLGVLTKREALEIAKSKNLDLIEITHDTNPPVAKIEDFGKYQYNLSKKEKETKSKIHKTETKTIQMSINTSDNDLGIKAKQAAEWIKLGNRIKIEMEVKGRSKALDDKFIQDRLNRMLAIIPSDYKIAEPLKKMPKCIFVVLEKNK